MTANHPPKKHAKVIPLPARLGYDRPKRRKKKSGVITRITIRNFMSHQETVIEPHEGVTLLTGPNNCGKSAVRVALECLCGDHTGNFMLRHGEKVASVIVETDEGHIIEWHREKSTGHYIINGREIRGARAPDDLQKYLRLPLVEGPNGETFNIHFADQKQPMFLINDTGSRPAVFFAAASDSRYLIKMQMLHTQNTRQKRSEQARVNRDLLRVEARLKHLETLPELDREMSRIEEVHLGLMDKEVEIGHLGETVQQLQENRRKLDAADTMVCALMEIPSLPKLQPTQALTALLRRWRRKFCAREQAWRSLEILESLTAPPELEPAPPLRASLQRLNITFRKVQVARQVGRQLESLPGLPELQPLRPLAEQVEKLSAAEHRMQKVEQEIRDAEQQLAELRAEVEVWVRDHPQCPACGQTLDPEAVLRRLNAPELEVCGHG